MIRDIFNKLVLDFQKVSRNNGFNNDVKIVTTKSITLDKLNIGNTPAVELFMISNEITPYDGVKYHRMEIGVFVYFMIEKSLGEENRIFDTSINIIEDMQDLLNLDLDIYKLAGVENFYLNQIMPFSSDDDNLGIIFLKYNLNYIN